MQERFLFESLHALHYTVARYTGDAAKRSEISMLHGHKFVVLESKRYRMDINLSDLKGVDPIIHGNSPRRVVSCVLSELGSTAGAPDMDNVM